MFSPYFPHDLLMAIPAQLPHHRSRPGDDAASGGAGSPLLQEPVASGLGLIDIGVYDGAY